MFLVFQSVSLKQRWQQTSRIIRNPSLGRLPRNTNGTVTVLFSLPMQPKSMSLRWIGNTESPVSVWGCVTCQSLCLCRKFVQDVPGRPTSGHSVIESTIKDWWIWFASAWHFTFVCKCRLFILDLFASIHLVPLLSKGGENFTAFVNNIWCQGVAKAASMFKHYARDEPESSQKENMVSKGLWDLKV